MSNNLDTVAQENILQNRREKIKLLNEMLAFTAKENEQLKVGDLDGFILTTKLWEALSKKIDALDKTNQAATALFTQQEGEKAAFNAELSRLDNEASDILRKIEKEQSECNAVAALKMEQYKGELRELKKSNQRVVSYTGSYAKSQDGIYIDQKK